MHSEAAFTQVKELRAAVVQWNRLRSGGLGIPERIGSNTDYGLSGDWASTRGNGLKVGELSDRRPPLGGVLQPINSHEKAHCV